MRGHALVGTVAAFALVLTGCASAQPVATSSSSGGAYPGGATKPPGSHPVGVGAVATPAGNPVSLAPLPAVAEDGAAGPDLPVYPRSTVSSSSSTAVSTQPTLDSGQKTGPLTFSVMPLVPFTSAAALDWTSAKHYSVSGTTYRLPASAGLVDGGAYLWKADSGATTVTGPLAFTVDLSSTKTQASDASAAVQVALPTGVAHVTWTSHTMEAMSGSVGIGMDYSGINSGWPGTPNLWRLVVPSPVPYDRLTVVTGGSGAITQVRVHSKDGSWVAYAPTPSGNGWFQPVVDATASSAASGTYGVLAHDKSGTWTLTSPQRAVATFAAAGSDGTAWLTSATSTGQVSVTTSYDGSTGRVTALTDPVSGKSATVAYGGGDCPSWKGFIAAPAGLVCRVTFWDGSTVGFGYVMAGSAPVLARIVDRPEAAAAGALVTDFGYDSSGRIATMRSPRVAAAAASPSAAPATGSNPAAASLLTQVTYDSSGRVASVTRPAASVGKERTSVTYSYDQTATTPTTTATASPSGHVLVTSYDPTTLATVKTTRDGVVTSSTTYDDDGNPVRVVDVAGGITTSTYDASGALTNRVGPYTSAGSTSGASSTSWTYDTTYGSTSSTATGTPMYGLDVTYWQGSTWEGAPAAEELGPLASASGAPWTASSVLSTTWTSSPVAGASTWSARMTGTLTLPAPASGDASKPDTYRFVVNGSNSPSLWVDQVQCTGTASTCASTGIQLAAGPHQIRIDLWADQGSSPSLQVMWGRNTTVLTPVPAQLVANGARVDVLTPGYHLTSQQSAADSLSSGDVTTMWNRTSYVAPQLAQVGKVWNLAGLATTTSYDDQFSTAGTKKLFSSSSSAQAPLQSGTVLPSGTALHIGYWGATDTASSGCAGQSSQLQIGRPRTITQPDPSTGAATGVATSLWYRDDGNVAAARTGDGALVCYGYDAGGRVTGTSTAGSVGASVLTIDYAAGGNPLVASRSSSVPGPDGTAALRISSTTTDLLGRTVASTDGWGTTQMIAYGDESKPVTVTTTTASGYTTTQTMTYDAAGNLKHTEVRDSIAGTTVLLSADAVYDAVGRITSATYSNGTSATFSYTPYEEAAGSAWTLADGTTWSTSRSFSRAGRILSATKTGGGRTAAVAYTYDTAARLKSATLTTDVAVSAKSWSFQYDADSNRTAQTVDGRTITYAYDKADRLTTVTGDPTLSGSVGYDSFGDVTSIGPLRITYDAAAMVTELRDTATSNSVAFVYDADEKAIAKTTTTGGVTTTVRYSAGNLMLDGTSKPVGQQVSLPGGVTVQRTIGSVSSQSWLVAGLDGSTWFTVDAKGAATSGMALYSPFGEALTARTAPVSPTMPTIGWTGGGGYETEALSVDVVPMGARAYVPALGRFLQVDPRAGGSANAYDYANQDPVNGSDPTGRTAWWKYLCAFLAGVVLLAGFEWLAAVATTALAAAIGAEGVAAVTVVACGAVIGAAGAAAAYTVQTKITGEKWSWEEFGIEVGIGAVLGGYRVVAELGDAETAVTEEAAPDVPGDAPPPTPTMADVEENPPVQAQAANDTAPDVTGSGHDQGASGTEQQQRAENSTCEAPEESSVSDASSSDEGSGDESPFSPAQDWPMELCGS